MTHVRNFATILGLIYLIYNNFVKTETETDDMNKWWVGLILAFLIILFLYQHYLTGKYKKYYDIFPHLNTAFTKIHSITNPYIEDNDSVEKDINILRLFCNDLKIAFDNKTGVKNTGVCVKVLAKTVKGYTHIITLTRDDKELEKNDLEEFEKGIHNYLHENTGFYHIFNEDENHIRNNYFFSNCLPWAKNYSNSRIIRDENFPPKKLWIKVNNTIVLGDIVSFLWWKLRYKSTIIVPIIPLNTKRIGEQILDDKRKSNVQIVGFLCIDSPNLFAFRKGDVDILRGIADGIYNCINYIICKTEKESIQSTRTTSRKKRIASQNRNK